MRQTLALEARLGRDRLREDREVHSELARFSTAWEEGTLSDSFALTPVDTLVGRLRRDLGLAAASTNRPPRAFAPDEHDRRSSA